MVVPTCSVYTDEECFFVCVYIYTYISIYIYVFVYTHIKAYLLIKISLSIPSVPQLQKVYLYLKFCVGRIRNSFYIVIVQKVKNILKVVFFVIE